MKKTMKIDEKYVASSKKFLNLVTISFVSFMLPQGEVNRLRLVPYIAYFPF